MEDPSPPSLVSSLASCYLHNERNATIVRDQITHRLRLASHWPITPGSRVLEIGCGQGDCTIVLAHLVGESGSVVALDPGPRDYGSPYTLGESQDFVKASRLGGRISFCRADAVEYLRDCEEGAFDAAVLCHCVWYFPSTSILDGILAALVGKTRKIVIAEWALRASRMEAVPHVLAALAQSALWAAKRHVGGEQKNVEFAISPAQIKEKASGHRWGLEKEDVVVPVDGMMDGVWEVSDVLGQGFVKSVQVMGDERQQCFVLAARESLKSSVDSVAGGVKGVKSMDVWTGVFVPVA